MTDNPSASTPGLRLVQTEAPARTSDSLEELLDPVAEARNKLSDAVGAQRTLATLAEQIAELEVECIELDLSASQTSSILTLSPPEAARLGALLERKRVLEAELKALLGQSNDSDDSSDTDQETRQVNAIAALTDWLAAPHVKESTRAATLARVVLLMAVIILGWAAYVLHPAMLVLVIPIAAPISLMLRRGENTQWRRMGARQKFELTGLTPPDEWEDDAVQTRLSEIEKSLERSRNEAPQIPQGGSDEIEGSSAEDELDQRFAELSYEQVDIELNLQRALGAAGLQIDELSDEQLAAFDQAAAANRTRKRLDVVRKERDALKKETDDRKDQIFQFLSSRGAAPSGGRADVAALSEALSGLE